VGSLFSLIVVLATLPVLVPLALIEKAKPALRSRTGLPLAMLFLTGYAFWTPRGTPPVGDGYFHGDSGRRHGRGYDFTRRLTATRYLAAIAMAVLLEGPSWAQTSGRSGGRVRQPPSCGVALSFNLAAYLVPNDQSYASPTFSADKRQFSLWCALQLRGSARPAPCGLAITLKPETNCFSRLPR